MLRVLPQAVFELDREGRFLAVHGGEIELIAPRDEVLGRLYADVLGGFPVLVKAMAELLTAAFAGERASSEYSLPSPGGERVYEARAVAATADRAIVVVSDVTESRRLLARLVVADRQRAVSSLGGLLVHEIATPTTYVLGSLETLSLRLPAGSEAAELLAIARDGAKQLAEICREFRALARADEAITDADPRETLARALRFSGPMRGAIPVEVDAVPVARVAVPEVRLGQVFLNLLANAAYALRAAPDPRIVVRVRERDGRVEVSVSDVGVGVAPENLGRIFEPFFTTKPSGEGTGLGLFVAKRLLEEHGATITCESRLGVGTTFHLSLPVVTPT